MIFQRVKWDMLADVWEALRPFVEAACARTGDRFTPKWVAQRLGSRTDALWVMLEADGTPRGIVTTHLGEYPTGLRVLEIIMLAGADVGRENARACWAALQAYKHEQGCARIEWNGRRGFTRWLGLDDARVLGVLCEVG